MCQANRFWNGFEFGLTGESGLTFGRDVRGESGERFRFARYRRTLPGVFQLHVGGEAHWIWLRYSRSRTVSAAPGNVIEAAFC